MLASPGHSRCELALSAALMPCTLPCACYAWVKSFPEERLLPSAELEPYFITRDTAGWGPSRALLFPSRAPISVPNSISAGSVFLNRGVPPFHNQKVGCKINLVGLDQHF